MGYTPAVRASRALLAVNVRKMCVRAISLARRKALTLAAISAAVCYTGLAADSDPLMFAGAFAALVAVRTLSGSATEKGGEK